MILDSDDFCMARLPWCFYTPTMRVSCRCQTRELVCPLRSVSWTCIPTDLTPTLQIYANEVDRRLLLLAKNVHVELGKHGSVRYVAERSQVSHTMITRFFQGESILRVDTIMAIEQFVETSVWPVY